jgi:WD40 repeat protein
VYSVAFSPDGKHVISGSQDNTLRLWDVRSGKSIGSPFKGHTQAVYSVAFSPDGTKIASGSWDKTLRLWDARNGHRVSMPFTGHTDAL